MKTFEEFINEKQEIWPINSQKTVGIACETGKYAYEILIDRSNQKVIKTLNGKIVDSFPKSPISKQLENFFNSIKETLIQFSKTNSNTEQGKDLFWEIQDKIKLYNK